MLVWNRLSFIQATASSEKLYKAPQLWSQDSTKPNFASHASHLCHKGTGKVYKSQRNKTKTSAEDKKHSKTMYCAPKPTHWQSSARILTYCKHCLATTETPAWF